ncbi:hypothetical protein ZHAS_00018372 [Anopheles sinensis]|uniref:Peptidase S1 domain-containing protein n=1 Tax=Anopheles sinensis TaxID=74873 RepID=A0A084WHM6_ANOSI|nr:hypothetical protein ZHAS_00018372 [Anopheles sinensis]
MTDFVQPACLLAEDEAQHFIVGKQGTIVGFGMTENDPVSEYLQEANLTVVEGLKCLEGARDYLSKVLTCNMFCSRGRLGVSACSGDSGGGMFFLRNETWYVRGIVSFIASPLYDGSCANSNFTVFTDVNKYLYWIMQFTIPKEIDNGIDSDFMLLSATHGMYSIGLSSGNKYNWHPKYGRNTVFDCKEGRSYGIEDNGVIFSVNHNGEDRKEFIRIEDEITCLAVDWIGRRLYWHNRSKKMIEVASLDDPYKRTVLISNIRSAPDMVVDPHRGKLYWADRFIVDSLRWSNLDGTNRRTLLTHRRNLYISSIKVLMRTGELCYSDLRSNQIGCINGYRNQIRNITTTDWSPFGLALTDSLFYWLKKYG